MPVGRKSKSTAFNYASFGRLLHLTSEVPFVVPLFFYSGIFLGLIFCAPVRHFQYCLSVRYCLFPLSIPCNNCPASSSGIHPSLASDLPPLSLAASHQRSFWHPVCRTFLQRNLLRLHSHSLYPHSHLLPSPWKGFFCCPPLSNSTPLSLPLLLLLLASCAASRLTFGGRRCLKAYSPEPLDTRDNGYPALILFLNSSEFYQFHRLALSRWWMETPYRVLEWKHLWEKIAKIKFIDTYFWAENCFDGGSVFKKNNILATLKSECLLIIGVLLRQFHLYPF